MYLCVGGKSVVVRVSPVWRVLAAAPLMRGEVRRARCATEPLLLLDAVAQSQNDSWVLDVFRHFVLFTCTARQVYKRRERGAQGGGDMCKRGEREK